VIATCVVLVVIAVVTISVGLRFLGDRRDREKRIAEALLALHQRSFPRGQSEPGETGFLFSPEEARVPPGLFEPRSLSFSLAKDQCIWHFDEHTVLGFKGVVRNYILKRSEHDSNSWHLSYHDGFFGGRRQIVEVKETPMPKP
jgi:hypothetical protein